MRISDWSSDVCSSDLLARLRGGFPLSLRLIREIHGILLAKGRGSDKEPGEFRRSQNWIGGSRPGTALYVPPPPNEVLRLMGELETFIHDEAADLPLLIKAGLVHVQVERAEEHTYELQSLMRNSYAVFCLKKKKTNV